MQNISITNGQNRINLPDLTQGIYFLKITMGQEIIKTEKIVVR